MELHQSFVLFFPDIFDLLILLAILFFAILLNALQEWRTRILCARLKKIIGSEYTVNRNGKELVVLASDLMTGDIFFVQKKQRVPAHARIVQSEDLRVDESEVTGETQAVVKYCYDMQGEQLFQEHINILFKGTSIIAGSGKAMVIAAGTQSIVSKMYHEPEQVCAVPKEIWGVPRLAFVVGLYRMATQKMLVKNMQAVQALGGADILLIDAIHVFTSNVSSLIQHIFDAGLKVVLITDAEKKTALDLARQAGIYKDGDMILESAQLSEMCDDNLIRILYSITVFASMTQAQKIRIIKVYHKLGKTVAMTGDSINNGLPGNATDLTISMERIGREITKQSSEVVLFHNALEYVDKAIEQCRSILYAIRCARLYFFVTPFASLAMILFALILHLPMPITVVQIVLLNLIWDRFLGLALAREPHEGGLLNSRWLRDRVRLADNRLWYKALLLAMPMAIGSLLVFYANYSIDIAYARTMTLLTMAMYQMFNAWNCRSERLSIMTIGFFSNLWLLLTSVGVLFLQIMLIYVPFMQTIFKTVPLTGHDWCIVLAITFPIVFLQEIRKFIARSLTNL